MPFWLMVWYLIGMASRSGVGRVLMSEDLTGLVGGMAYNDVKLLRRQFYHCKVEVIASGGGFGEGIFRR